MRRLVAALILLLSTPAMAEWSIATMNIQIDATNFVVNRGCSGTLVSVKDRFILTAAHCVDDQYETVESEEITNDGEVRRVKRRVLKPGTVSQLSFIGTQQVRTEVYRTRLIKVDRDRDLALLQVIADLPNKTESRIACIEPVRGERAYLVGNPFGILYSTVHAGLVSSVQRDMGMLGADRNQDKGLMQISAGAVGGNSGGATYNDKGELIGVLVLGHPYNEVFSFAVPLPDIKSFLDGNLKVACEQ